MDPTHLLNLADRILSSPESADLIPVLGEYSEAFAAWYDENRSALENLSSLPPDDPLFVLQKKHNDIVNLSVALKGEVLSELRALKKKGKGILAYTDVFPKQGSSSRPRKL